MLRYPYDIIKKQINDTTVTLVGVEHTKSFFHVHKNLLEKLIKSNDSVFLEKPIHLDFWEVEFYNELGYISNFFNKKVYQSDPRTSTTHRFDHYVQPLIAGLFLLSMGKEGKKTEYTRRDFLNSAGKMSIGLGLAWGTSGASILRDFVSRDTGYSLDDMVSYGEFDYSNVLIADGLVKLSKKDEQKKIVAFHGELHNKKIAKYLDNSVLRNIKKLYYFPYEALGTPFVREYTPLKTGWTLTDVF